MFQSLTKILQDSDKVLQYVPLSNIIFVLFISKHLVNSQTEFFWGVFYEEGRQLMN